MDDARKMLDVTSEYERMRAQMMLMRVHLGLDPCHDILTAIRVLYDEGREAMEKMRGPRCEHAHLWKPL